MKPASADLRSAFYSILCTYPLTQIRSCRYCMFILWRASNVEVHVYQCGRRGWAVNGTSKEISILILMRVLHYLNAQQENPSPQAQQPPQSSLCCCCCSLSAAV